MNWKIILGALIIFGGLKEMLSILMDYRSGRLMFYPAGAELGCLFLVILGVFLIRSGRKQKDQLK